MRSIIPGVCRSAISSCIFAILVATMSASCDGGGAGTGAISRQGAVRTATSAAVRVTDDELKASVGRKLARTGTTKEKLPGGGTLVRLGEGFHHVSVMKRNPDGSLTTACVSSPGELSALIDGDGKAGAQ